MSERNITCPKCRFRHLASLTCAEAKSAAEQARDARSICDGCDKEIDPDTCGCGSPIDHSRYEGHSPVPMGCDCQREKTATQAYTSQMDLFHRVLRDIRWLLQGAPDERIRRRLAYVVTPDEYITLNRCVIKSYSDPVGELRIMGVPVIAMRDFNNENPPSDRRVFGVDAPPWVASRPNIEGDNT